MSTQPVSDAERIRRIHLRTALRTLVEHRLRPRVQSVMQNLYSGVCNMYHQKSPAQSGGHVDLHYFKLRDDQPRAQIENLERAFAPIIEYARTMDVVMTVRVMSASTISLLDMSKTVERNVNLIVSFCMVDKK